MDINLPAPEEIMNELYIVVCRQTDCFDRGEPYTGTCAACADIADDVVETYLKLNSNHEDI